MARNNPTSKAYVTIDGKQAEEEMKKLQAESQRLRAEIIRAKKTGDFEGLVKAQDELKKINSQMKQVERSTRIYNDVLKNLSTASIADLRRAQKELTLELERTTRGTQEYVDKAKKLEEVRNELNKTTEEMKGLGDSQEGFFSKATEGFSKYFGILAGMVTAFMGVVFSLRETIDAFNEFEAGAQELSAITELVGPDLDYLKDKAKELSVSVSEDGIRITSSATEILEAFKLMGGAKAELLKDKEALTAVTREALILAEATKMETAAAVESLANTMNQFGASAEEARRYINALAAGSTAGAAEVDDISQSMVKMGTVASMANITVEESVALLETLADKGVKAEIAGTQLKSVLLKLQAGQDDFNPAIVGMSNALDNLAAANLSTEEATKMFGMESVVAAQILIQNRDRYNELTEAVTDTDTAYIQAAKNSDTNAAALKQAENAVNLSAIALGERLSPALTMSAGLFSKLLNVGIKVLDWVQKNTDFVITFAKAIGVGATALVSYTVATKLITLWKTKHAQATLFNLVAEKSNQIAMAIGRSATLAYAAAKALLTGNIQRAAVAMRAFSIASGTNPYGILIAATAALVAGLIAYRKELFGTKEALDPLSNVQSIYNVKVQEETEKLEQLKQQLQLTRPGSEARKQILQEINEKYPDLLGNMDAEKASLGELTGAIDAYIKKLEQRILAQVLVDEITSIYRQKEEVARDKELSDYERYMKLKKLDEDKGTLARRLVDLQNQNMYGERYVELLREQQQLTEKLANTTIEEDPMSKTSYFKMIEGAGQFDKKSLNESYTQYLADFKANNEDLKNAQIRLGEIQSEIQKELDSAPENQIKSKSLGKFLTEDELKAAKKLQEERDKLLSEYVKKVNTQLENLHQARNTANERELNEIRQKYFEDEKLAREKQKTDVTNASVWADVEKHLVLNRNAELNNKRLEQEKKFTQSLWNARKEAGKISLNELEEAEQLSIEQQYAKQEIGLEEFLFRQEEIQSRYQKSREEKEKEHTEKIWTIRDKYGLVSSKEKMQAELAALKSEYDAKLLTATEYETAKAAIEKKYSDESVKSEKEAADKKREIQQKYFQGAQTLTNALSELFSDAKESELKTAGDNEEKKKKINQKYADVEMGIKIAQIGASTALAVMQSFAQLGPIAGAVAAAIMGATGIVQIGLAIKERNRIRGFEDGVYPVTDHLGRKFNARRGGKPTTQLVKKPTVFLAGEQGENFPEMIVDGTTFRNLQVNFPEAVDAIYAARNGYQGFEGGMYPSRAENAGSLQTAPNVIYDPELTSAIKKLNDKLENGIRSTLVYRDLKEMEDTENKIRDTLTT